MSEVSSDRECARVLALADDPASGAVLDAEWRAMVAEQRTVAALVRDAAAQARAPLALRQALAGHRK